MPIKYFLALFFFCSLNTFGQVKLEFGEVKPDSNFITIRNDRQSFLDSVYWNIKSIVDSKNELEIRLNSQMPPSSELIVISNNAGTWNAEKFKRETSGPFDKISSAKIKMAYTEEKMFEHVFRNIFDTLKKNNIFLLPNQSELVLKTSGGNGHGGLFTVTFKAGNKFRRYRFTVLKTDSEQNPEIKELLQYAVIVQTMNSLF